MIIALAGHVDHGKTSLVRALTGVNTDRLEEEQRRGLTIDLGFAYLDGGEIGFVDVPGHHKFIHNMVAGVARDQIALLVIAADDGPMPQSKEHLDILSLMGLKQGLIAMTKCDRVTDERQDECEQEIRKLTTNTFLSGAPIFRTSTEASESFAPLLKSIHDHATEPETQSDGLFRLAIDRAFTVKGSGVVVTGTVHEGSVSVDDTLSLFPSDKPVRVRGLRAQNRTVEQAVQGDRCAINLSGVDLDEVQRGQWLSALTATPYLEVSVELQVLNDFPRPVKQWTPVHVYHATSHAQGHIALLDNQLAANRLQPGSKAIVDLVLDSPLAVQSGDQIIVRDHGLDTTLGGGRVIYASAAPTQRRRNHERVREVHAFADGNASSALEKLLTDQHTPNLTDFKGFWQLTDDAANALLKTHDALKLNDHIIARTHLGALAKSALEEVTTHALNHPDSLGVKENELNAVPAQFATQVLGALVKTKKLNVNNGLYTPANHQAALPPELANIYERLQSSLNTLQPPSSGDLAKAWGMPLGDLEARMRDLSKRSLLIFISDHRYYLPEQISEIALRVRNMAKDAPFTVREFRDQTGIGRNVAIDLLEYFDSKGFTRRQDNHRVLLRDTL